MPRAYPHSHLCNGQLIGFSVRHLGDESTYIACFRSPAGRRLKRDTNQRKLVQAIEAARAVIEAEYAPPRIQTDKTTWDQATKRLTLRLGTSGHRSSTLSYYLKLIRSVRTIHDKAEGPEDITPSMAAGWRDSMMNGKNLKATRKEKPRSAHYIAGMLDGLSALWQKWLVDDLKIVATNPWREVDPPKTDKLPVKYASDEQIELFYAWLAERFGKWVFPKLFLSAKAYTGCRLMDLCSLKSSQLRGGRLVFPPDLTKGRKERQVPLQADLFKALDAFKGKTWLWENYPLGLKAALQEKGFPTHQLKAEFSAQRLYYWVETLFTDYRTAYPDRPPLTSHMFRKRAFTMAWQKGIDPRRAAIAYGCNVDTLMGHYVAMDEQQVTDDVFAQMNEKKKKSTKG